MDFKLYFGLGICSFPISPKKICSGKIKFKGEPTLNIGFKELQGDIESLRNQCHIEIDRFIGEAVDYANKKINPSTVEPLHTHDMRGLQ